MAETLLKQGSQQDLTAVGTGNFASIANGAAVATPIATALAPDDTSPHPDEVRVDVDYTTSGTASLGQAVNIYLAEADTAGNVDGDITAGAVQGGLSALPNLGVPVPIINQFATDAGGPSRGSGVFRATKARF